MHKTFELLKPLAEPAIMSLSLETMAEMYQSKQESKVLASAYCDIYKLAVLVSHEYYGLDETDLASWCLEKLDFSLKTFDHTKNFKFVTYFSKVYRNKLREETEKLSYKKRKSLLVSINDILEEGVYDVYNLITLMLPKDLTAKEMTYCMLASEGYDNGFIAQELKCSRMTISNIRKSLKVKCANL